jgi:ribose 5-phosphate isomerase B
MNKLKIAIGGDHAGYLLKEEIKNMLVDLGHDIKDFGPFSQDSVDYPDYAHPIAIAVQNKEFNYGILICGTANGVNIVANKHKGIRSALCWQDKIAELARSHNDANIIALPARFIELTEAKKTVLTFINTAFEGGRHANRVNKINQYC